VLRRDLLPARRLHAEPLPDYGDERPRFHGSDAREIEQPSLEVATVLGLRPDASGVAGVVVRDRRGQILDATGHRSRVAVKCRLLAERALEAVGIHRGELAGVEGADAALELERAAERLLHGDLLVEREADQERHRVAAEQFVRLRIAREVQGIRLRDRHEGDPIARR
jgi:hypothetical protein